jgi:hypothetical protein
MKKKRLRNDEGLEIDEVVRRMAVPMPKQIEAKERAKKRRQERKKGPLPIPKD